MLEVHKLCYRQHRLQYIEEREMPEVRATLSAELHRKLKAEAAQKGMHLKELIAQILEEHVKAQKEVSTEK